MFENIYIILDRKIYHDTSFYFLKEDKLQRYVPSMEGFTTLLLRNIKITGGINYKNKIYKNKKYLYAIKIQIDYMINLQNYESQATCF